jgi:hypothetical protein
LVLPAQLTQARKLAVLLTRLFGSAQMLTTEYTRLGKAAQLRRVVAI